MISRPPGGHVLQHRLIERLVLRGDDSPCGLLAPRSVLHGRGEDRHVDRHLRVPQERGVGVARVVGEAGLEFLRIEETVTVVDDIDDELRRRGETLDCCPVVSPASGASAET